MSVQHISISDDGKDRTSVFGNLKSGTISAFQSVREFLKQTRSEQWHFNNVGTRSMRAHQSYALNDLPLKEKHSLGLYHLMD